jgi:predicted component of type VI protein secretion system
MVRNLHARIKLETARTMVTSLNMLEESVRENIKVILNILAKEVYTGKATCVLARGLTQKRYGSEFNRN